MKNLIEKWERASARYDIQARLLDHKPTIQDRLFAESNVLAVCAAQLKQEWYNRSKDELNIKSRCCEARLYFNVHSGNYHCLVCNDRIEGVK